MAARKRTVRRKRVVRRSVAARAAPRTRVITRTVTKFKTRKMAKKKVRRSKRNMMTGPLGKALAGMGYGLARQPLSNLVASVIPGAMGQLGDEVIMTGANMLIAQNTKGLLKKVANAGTIIESSRLGASLISGGLGRIGSPNAGTGGSNLI